jgi:hypothetical protein
MFENRVLRSIFEHTIEEVTEGWRKLHNEELHNFYLSPIIIRAIKSRRMGWVRHIEYVGEKKYAYKVFVRKPGGKIPIERGG